MSLGSSSGEGGNEYSLEQLKWHRHCISGSANHIYRPCIVISDDGEGCESLIEYISSSSSSSDIKRTHISTKRLIPYYGYGSPSDGWCVSNLKSYKHFLKSQQQQTRKRKCSTSIKQELEYLTKLFEIAKENTKTMSDDDDSSSDSDDMDDGYVLEEPYTQALGLEDTNNEPSLQKMALADKPKREPIRPGDVIEYYTHVFVAGDNRGRRQTKVLSVDSKRDPILVLQNGDYLTSDTQVKRIQESLDGNLVHHPGIFRPIEEFKLKKSALTGYETKGIETGIIEESNRLGRILNQNLETFAAKANQDGFAPLDMLHTFGRSKKRKDLTPLEDDADDFYPKRNTPSTTKQKHSISIDITSPDHQSILSASSTSPTSKTPTTPHLPVKNFGKKNHLSSTQSSTLKKNNSIPLTIHSSGEENGISSSSSDEELDSRLEKIRQRHEQHRKKSSIDDESPRSLSSRSSRTSSFFDRIQQRTKCDTSPIKKLNNEKSFENLTSETSSTETTSPLTIGSIMSSSSRKSGKLKLIRRKKSSSSIKDCTKSKRSVLLRSENNMMISSDKSCSSSSMDSPFIQRKHSPSSKQSVSKVGFSLHEYSDSKEKKQSSLSCESMETDSSPDSSPTSSIHVQRNFTKKGNISPSKFRLKESYKRNAQKEYININDQHISKDHDSPSVLSSDVSANLASSTGKKNKITSFNHNHTSSHTMKRWLKYNNDEDDALSSSFESEHEIMSSIASKSNLNTHSKLQGGKTSNNLKKYSSNESTDDLSSSSSSSLSAFDSETDPRVQKLITRHKEEKKGKSNFQKVEGRKKSSPPSKLSFTRYK